MFAKPTTKTIIKSQQIKKPTRLKQNQRLKNSENRPKNVVKTTQKPIC